MTELSWNTGLPVGQEDEVELPLVTKEEYIRLEALSLAVESMPSSVSHPIMVVNRAEMFEKYIKNGVQEKEESKPEKENINISVYRDWFLCSCGLKLLIQERQEAWAHIDVVHPGTSVTYHYYQEED